MVGTLYIVATPIGNLEDITLRALRLLREADLVAAEDTRHTRKLLAHFEITTPLIAYHQHSDAGRVENLIRRLSEEGQSIALVTDAGTPGVSDPGVELVEAALAAGIPVVPVPGASAALCALVGSGLPPARFAFEGFLPRTKSSRLAKLKQLAASEARTLIFYEAPNRTADTLKEMAAAFGPARPAAVGRELTKRHEEFTRGPLAEVAARFAASPPRGEITIVISGPESPAPPALGTGGAAPDVPAALAAALAEGLTERDAVRRVAADLRLGRREVYAAMLEMKK
ncbi:MAG: 16S rRNA (cytidine(1402)-2'-O)-methyltransferase [Armatimonadetes bacterium]|nr:16S rRNA (cytidine(1402)-2'-O)-methyltransferase [Armatimonadota bacterium]